jgi:hypothetical protein
LGDSNPCAYSAIGSVLRVAETTLATVGDFELTAHRSLAEGQWAVIERTGQLNGFRNRNLQELLYEKQPDSPAGRAIVLTVPTTARTSLKELNRLAKAA